MAGMNFFNLGQAHQAGQQIKYNRLRNQALQQELDTQSDVIRNRAKADEIRRQQAQIPDQIQALEAQGMYDEASKLRNSYIQTQKSGIDLLSSMRDAITADNYKQVRSQLIQAGAIDGAMMPVEYSDAWFKKEIADKKGNLQKLTRTWSEQGAPMSQDLVTQDGEILWEGTPYPANAKSRGSQAKPFTMEAADSNAIRSATAQLYGSIWDPRTGRYAGLNRQQEQELASVAEEAAKIYNANEGQIPHPVAVARAARKMGIQIRDLQRDPNNRDPAGIR